MPRVVPKLVGEELLRRLRETGVLWATFDTRYGSQRCKLELPSGPDERKPHPEIEVALGWKARVFLVLGGRKPHRGLRLVVEEAAGSRVVDLTTGAKFRPTKVVAIVTEMHERK
ncbi:MAG: hypothetical protein M0R22_00410 [Dehalococcoidia bacterium]|jgi:hypothetical protein|nr:hypothetical protein [Dehalococcoidia bacterium]